jgi:GDP-L-fucose synthase
MDQTTKIYLAGHRGLVGAALLRRLRQAGFERIVTRSRPALDLRDQGAVRRFFEAERPEYVFLAAAKVGGILANHTYPADFIYDNLMIETNVLHCAYRYGVKKLLFLGSSCIYPKNCPQPIREEYLLSGYLEPTNEAYAVAKIAGVKLCQFFNQQYGARFICAMPCNLYGPGDNFHPQNSHVLPALLSRIHQAKLAAAPTVTIWGTGTPLREFLYVDDLADACLLLMEQEDAPDLINVGSGTEIAIAELAERIKSVTGYRGRLEFDAAKPDGTPRKILDSSRIQRLGWTPQTDLETGLRRTYRWYLENSADLRGQ